MNGATTWPSVRIGLAIAGVLCGVATGLLAVAINAPATEGPAAGLCIACLAALGGRGTVSLVAPLGAVLAWTAAAGEAAPSYGPVPIVAGVVLAAELLGEAGSAAIVVSRPWRPSARRSVLLAVGAAGVAAVAITLSALPGPDGTAATVVAAVGAGVVALVLLGPGQRKSGAKPAS